MSLSRLLNVAYVLLTEKMDSEAREQFDRRLAGFTGPTPRRAAEASRDLMAAMGLAAR